MARKPRRPRPCVGERRAWRQTTRPVPARPLCSAERVSTPESLLTPGVLTTCLRTAQPWPLERKLRGRAPSGGGGDGGGRLPSRDSSRQRIQPPAVSRMVRGGHSHLTGQQSLPHVGHLLANLAAQGLGTSRLQPRSCAQSAQKRAWLGWAGAVACQGAHSPSSSGPDASSGRGAAKKTQASRQNCTPLFATSHLPSGRPGASA